MADAFSPRTILLSAIVGAAVVALEPSCLERRADETGASADARCTACHGDEQRPGDFVMRSAPPRDLFGATDHAYPGVGAHAIHLYGSDTHAAFACSECHVVPERTDSPGHADDARPAELFFGPLSRTGGRTPSYDAAARTCQDSHCHGAANAVWTEPRSSERACGSCHGLPPPAPHPRSERCFACHAEVIDERREFIAPELHVDGVTQYAPGDCSLCHGDSDSPAPPFDTLGNAATSAIGVGAHRAHLDGSGFSRPLACSECHLVPGSTDVSSHVGPLPAEVRLMGVAETGGREPLWNRESSSCAESWCHGPGPRANRLSPGWVASSSLGCSSCHDMPPSAPHPQSDDCSNCHAAVVADDDVTIVNRERHVDGMVDVGLDQDCTSCHGSDNPAPPLDLARNTTTDSPGVGAHRVHLAGTPRSRAVPCGECHLVPNEVFDPGHLDSSGPAEVSFSGAANAFGDLAAYVDGSCQNTSCHGGVFPDDHLSGGTNSAPVWTRVDGTQAACGTCHSLPPPAPHPRGDLNPTCSACHENIDPDNATFSRPDLHVDGVVTFELP